MIQIEEKTVDKIVDELTQCAEIYIEMREKAVTKHQFMRANLGIQFTAMAAHSILKMLPDDYHKILDLVAIELFANL